MRKRRQTTPVKPEVKPKAKPSVNIKIKEQAEIRNRQEAIQKIEELRQKIRFGYASAIPTKK